MHDRVGPELHALGVDSGLHLSSDNQNLLRKGPDRREMPGRGLRALEVVPHVRSPAPEPQYTKGQTNKYLL